jgi:hypothetical protein
MCGWHLRCADVLYVVPRSSVILNSVFSEFRAEATSLATSGYVSVHVDCRLPVGILFYDNSVRLPCVSAEYLDRCM